MSDIEEVSYKPSLNVSVSVSMAAILDNFDVVAAVHTRPRAIPLAMITIRKSIHGFSFLFVAE